MKQERKLIYKYKTFQINKVVTLHCFSPVQPNLVDGFIKKPVPVSVMESNICIALDSIVADMEKRPDSEKDRMDRLTVITRILPSFSLDELKFLYREIKEKDSVVQ